MDFNGPFILTYRKEKNRINAMAHKGKPIRESNCYKCVTPSSQYGTSRKKIVLRMFMKAIMLRFVCGFCQFFINGFCKAGQFFLMF